MTECDIKAVTDIVDGAHIDSLAKFSQQHRNSLYRFILRRVHDHVEAEELTQQTFVEAMNGIARFRGDAQIRTWLYSIAENLIKNHFCRSPRYRFQWEDEDVLESSVEYAVNPEAASACFSVLQRVQYHIDTLPAEMQETLSLVAFHEMSYEEVAAHLNISVGTVKSRIARIRVILCERLEEEGAQIDN